MAESNPLFHLNVRNCPLLGEEDAVWKVFNLFLRSRAGIMGERRLCTVVVSYCEVK